MLIVARLNTYAVMTWVVRVLLAILIVSVAGIEIDRAAWWPWLMWSAGMIGTLAVVTWVLVTDAEGVRSK
jgi:hypothetical protein